MIDKEVVMKVLFAAADMINNQLRKDEQLEKSTNTFLIGEKSKLDSLGLINFILAVEQMIEEKFQIPVLLTENEDLLFSSDGPFKTIGTLGEYITEQLTKRS